MKEVVFNNYRLQIIMGTYHNDSPKMTLWDNEGPYMIASALLPQKPDDGNILIKNYSENEGILNALVENNIISVPVRSIRSGYVEIFECKLL
jgi:hypothetical protein